MSKDGRRSANLKRYRDFDRSTSHRPSANLGAGRNINNPNPRRRSARRAHRSFHGSAFAITTLRIRALAERLRLLDFCIAGLMTVGCSLGVSVATWAAVGPPMDERYSSRTQPR